MPRIRPVLLALLATTALAVVLTSSANADGSGSISCALVGGGTLPLAASGDYTLAANQTISCTISGATAPAGGGSTTTVFVKHGGNATTSNYPLQPGSNNEMVPATYANGVVTFTYSTGGLSTCQTAAVSYNNTSGAVNNSKGANSTFNFNAFCGGSTPPPPPAASPLSAGAGGSASYTRTYAWAIDKSVDRSSASYVVGSAAPVFDYTVTVSHDAGTDGGWSATGSVAANNPNAAAVSGATASISDSHCNVSGGAQAVPGAGSATWSFSCSYPAAGPSSLSATVAWPSQTLGDGSTLAAGSASASASLDWSNPTSVVNGSVDVTDSAGALGSASASASASSPATFTYPLQLDGTAGTCSPFTNTASLSGGLGSSSQTVTVCAVENPAVGTASANDSFTRTYAWSVGKSSDSARRNIPAGGSATFNYTVTVGHDAGTDSGWQASGTITASNGNDSAIAGAAASIADASCSVSDPQSIPAGGSASWSFSCSWNSAPPASEAVALDWPAQTLASGGDLPAGEAGGQLALDWSTPSSVVNGSVGVNDSRAGALGTVAVGGANPATFTYAESFAGAAGTCTPYDNVASLSTGESASASVTVCDGVDLAASATSGTTFTRTYAWTVAKAVNGSSLIEKTGGGSGSFSYTVKVGHDAGTDSAWQAAGTITVTNPNDWEAIAASVSDAVDNGGTCTVSNGGGVTLAAGASATLSYVCTYAAAPSSLTGTDTVTIAWSAASASTPDGSIAATAPVAFGAPTTVVNGTAVVNDSLRGQLGTLSATGPTSTSYTYSLSFPVPASNCATHPNVASLSTGASASASVELCGPAATGALSMGFWSNKNGQAIITGGSSTNGACNVGTWLRGFAPFQDLASGASCTAVNSYVQGVITAANARGAAMNAMLKSQMLAVALDSYFSDGSLGGNKVAAPGAGVGTYGVDLTNVSGENVSAAFGGATRLTIAQMLAYAASQSNGGGSAWYGQNKTTQGLAKDAFDAICNGLVFSP